MPEPLTTEITEWRNVYTEIGNHLEQMALFFDTLAVDAYDHGWWVSSNAYIKLRMETRYLRDHFKYEAYTSNLYTKMYDAMHWIDVNWPIVTPPIPVTMDAILSAMLTATKAQIPYFIGIEDAYRVYLWNAPFNADFYAALARGWATW